VNNSELNDILDHLENANEQAIEQLDRLAHQYPYAASIFILKAIISGKHDQAHHKKHLSKAAVYTVDRNNLKQLIQEGKPLPGKVDAERKKVEEPITQNTSDRPVINEQTHDVPEPREQTSESPATSVAEDSSTLFKEVLDNLNVLKSLREKYKFLEEKEEHGQPIRQSESSSSDPDRPEQKPAENSENAESHAEAHLAPSGSDDEAETLLPPVQEEQEVNDQMDEAGEDHHRAQAAFEKNIDEQYEIIRNYINNEPDYVSRKKEKVEESDKEDLSLESIRINDDLISENLALLLIQQGKTEKAIDIYKKLIWKFPQKKAYFASRIEELTKE